MSETTWVAVKIAIVACASIAMFVSMMFLLNRRDRL